LWSPGKTGPAQKTALRGMLVVDRAERMRTACGELAEKPKADDGLISGLVDGTM